MTRDVANLRFESVRPGQAPDWMFSLYLSSGPTGIGVAKLESYGDIADACRLTLAHTPLGRLVGVHKYQVNDPGWKLHSNLTWVARDWRGVGLAPTLWNVSLAASRPRGAEVWCITESSERMVQRVAKRHPRIDWWINQI